jgi:hypothetical protein
LSFAARAMQLSIVYKTDVEEIKDIESAADSKGLFTLRSTPLCRFAKGAGASLMAEDKNKFASSCLQLGSVLMPIFSLVL